MAFIFGGNTPWTYEDIQRKRRVADELVAANATAPRNVGEGLAAIGRALAGRAIEKRASARDAELKADFERQFGGLFGGQSPSAAPGVPQPIASGPVAPPDPNNPAQIGADTMAALGKPANLPSKDEVSAYITSAAAARGIDPSVALAVASSEGLNANPAEAWQSNFVKNGKREESYGPFQLYLGGGLGNNFVQQTGLDPRDRSTWKKQVDFALDHAKGNGWGSWYGAANAGIGNWDGINGAKGGAQQGFDPSTIMGLIGNPYASPGQKAVLEALLGQQMNAADPAYQLDLALKRAELAQAQAPDPMKAIDLQKAQLELAQMQAPDPGFTMVSPEQAKAMGLPPGAYQVGPDGKVSQIGGGGTNVTVNNGGNSNKFREESDKAASARFDEYIQGGTAAAQMVGDLKAIADLAPQIGTGKGAEVMSALGPYAEAFGIDVTGLDEAQAFKSIVDRMAPQMRPAGSGSSSDFDARQFLNSLPKLGNTPEGNQIILQTLQALQAHKMAAAQIASLAYQDPANGGITWQEAEKRIRALGDPYEAFNAYSRKNTRGTNGPAESGGDPPAPAVADDDAAYLKSLGLE